MLYAELRARNTDLYGSECAVSGQRLRGSTYSPVHRSCSLAATIARPERPLLKTDDVSSRLKETLADAAPDGRQHGAARRAYAGLSASEAARRLRAEGPNALPAERDHRLLRLILGVLAEPMFLLLCVAVALYVVLGDLREALVLAASLIAVVAITVVQERRTGRALAALRDLSSPRAAVVRDGELQRIAGREVVRGDIVLLSEGDRVPADGLLRESTALEVDESLLTGESVPVPKQADPGASGDVATARGLARLRVFRNVGGTRARHRGDHRDRRHDRSRTDRARARAAAAAGHASLPGNPTPGPVAGAVRSHSVSGGGAPVRVPARRLGRRRPRRDHARDEHPAGRIPRRAHGVPGHRRLASFETQRPDPQHAGDRDAGCRHGAGSGQDRHSHREPHGSRRAG